MPTAHETALLGAFGYRPQRGGAAQRRVADAAAAARLVELELCLRGERSRPGAVGHLLDEPAAGHRRRAAAVRHAQPDPPARSRQADPHAISTTIPSSMPPPAPRRPSSGRCRGCATAGIAAPISARVSMRTACSRGSPSPSNSAASAARGASPTNRGASRSPRPPDRRRAWSRRDGCDRLGPLCGARDAQADAAARAPAALPPVLAAARSRRNRHAGAPAAAVLARKIQLCSPSTTAIMARAPPSRCACRSSGTCAPPGWYRTAARSGC